MAADRHPLRIAMVAACPFPANRGTPSRILRMAEGLTARGHQVEVVTYHFGEAIAIRGVPIHRIPRVPYRRLEPGPTLTKLLLLDPLLALKLYRVVREHSIRLIHAHHFEGALVATLVGCLTGAKTIYDAHTSLAGELHYYWRLGSGLANFLDRKVPRWAHHVIAVSSALRDALTADGIAPDRIDVVPTGVNSEHFPRVSGSQVREHLKLDGKQVVMYTGSLASFQGIPNLLQAMRLVCRRLDDVVLVLVGGGKVAALHKLVEELGLTDKVLFAGARPFEEVPGYLAAADVAVLPRGECPGIPQKLLNYMIAGKAIVSCEAAAGLIDHRRSGWVVANGSPGALADGIVALLADSALRDRLGRKAQKEVSENFEWGGLCEKLEAIYRRVLAAG